MSKIVVTVERVENRSEFLTHVRAITGVGLADISNRIGTGLPLVEYVLFLNNHEDVAQRLRSLVALETIAQLKIFELMPDENFAGCPREQCEISTSVLLNILDAHEMQRRQLET